MSNHPTLYAYATKFTRMQLDGDQPDPNNDRNFLNRKPFRSAAQKATARKTASTTEDGNFNSPTGVSFHAIGARR